MVHVPSAHASVRTCSYIYWLVVVVVVGVGCMRDVVVTSEAGDWLRPCHWLAGSLARALEQWSEPTVTGDTAAPRSLSFWLPGCCWLTGWGHWLLLQQPLEMGAPGALAGPCPLFIIYMTCPVSSTLDYSYMAAAM